MSPLQPAFQSHSVPTSPAVSRSSKNYPITPERGLRHQRYRATQSFYKSPTTPSTPYTPLSLRSIESNNSSILTTPDNFSLCLKKRIPFTSTSPELSKASARHHSIADIANNWRSRANENNVRASSVEQAYDHSHYRDDGATDLGFSDAGNDSNIFSDALLPPFLSNQPGHVNNVATRTRTQSQISFPLKIQPKSPTVQHTGNYDPLPVTPLRSRRSQNQPAQLLFTPPPNRNLTKQLKLKGSLTDPPHTRRREAFGVVRTAQTVNASLNTGYPVDMSMELFDINENECEQETNHDVHEDESFSSSLQAHQANALGYPEHTDPSFPQYNMSDPFPTAGMNVTYSNASIADSIERHFHTLQQPHYSQHLRGLQDRPRDWRMVGTTLNLKPVHVLLPSADTTSHSPSQNSTPLHSLISTPIPTSSANPSPLYDCSVCLIQSPPSLAVLKPCGHPLCSGCLTSALNIVGEKDMECAVCKQGVEDFKLVVNTKPKASHTAKDSLVETKKFSPLISSPIGSNATDNKSLNGENDSFGDLDNGFEFGIDFTPSEIRASTPKLESSLSLEKTANTFGSSVRDVPKPTDNAVLRIDNVPWDITPSQINDWLRQPVQHVHVLLDSKGKTLSHAYVEIQDQRIAGAILRGEAVGPGGRKKDRGSILGRGRRARGVTITRSSQEELMADLFPHWKGNFDGSRPSLAGLEGERMIGALEGGLLTEGEITSLLYLIREPDSHFLKVPSLPFHSLISLLRKFPTDVDSRVFWSANIRNMLFAAVEVLLGRLGSPDNGGVGRSKIDLGYNVNVLKSLIEAALQCQAFTSQQTHKLRTFASSKSIPFSDPCDTPFELGNDQRSAKLVESDTRNQNNITGERLGELAKEFGVEAGLVQALAQRLANLA